VEDGGKCLKIIRIENGKLSELVRKFIETTGGGLPPGSVVLLGSLAELGATGIEAYANEVCRARSALLAGRGRDLIVVPFLPLPLDGHCSPGLSRDSVELISWFQAQLDGCLTNYHGRYLELISIGSSNRELAAHYPKRLCLPENESGKSHRIFHSIGHTNLPITTKPVSEDEEGDILPLLIDDLNSAFELNLDPRVRTNRRDNLEQELKSQLKPAFVVCGGSHASRLADALRTAGQKVFNLSRPGFLCNTEQCEQLQTELADCLSLLDGWKVIVVFQALDNCSFFSSTGDGGMNAIKKDARGRYHVPGEVVVLPRERILPLLRKLELCLNTGEAAIRIMITPMPRYIFDACCSNNTHCTNGVEGDFAEKMLSSLVGLWKETRDHLRGGGRRRGPSLSTLCGLLQARNASPVKTRRRCSMSCGAERIRSIWTKKGTSSWRPGS
jgi:hypothetical protein